MLPAHSNDHEESLKCLFCRPTVPVASHLQRRTQPPLCYGTLRENTKQQSGSGHGNRITRHGGCRFVATRVMSKTVRSDCKHLSVSQILSEVSCKKKCSKTKTSWSKSCPPCRKKRRNFMTLTFVKSRTTGKFFVTSCAKFPRRTFFQVQLLGNTESATQCLTLVFVGQLCQAFMLLQSVF